MCMLSEYSRAWADVMQQMSLLLLLLSLAVADVVDVVGSIKFYNLLPLPTFTVNFTVSIVTWSELLYIALTFYKY